MFRIVLSVSVLAASIYCSAAGPARSSTVDFSVIDRQMADAVRSGGSVRGTLEQWIASAPRSNDEAELDGIDLRRTAALAIDRLAATSPSNAPIAYWRQADLIIDALRANAAFDASREVPSALRTLIDAVWSVYVDALVPASGSGEQTPIADPAGDRLIGQWFDQTDAGGVAVAELYASPRAPDLAWSQRSFDAPLSPPLRALRNRSGLEVLPATDRDVLVLFADLSGLAPERAAAIRQAALSADRRFLEVLLGNRAQEEAKCTAEAAERARLAAEEKATEPAVQGDAAAAGPAGGTVDARPLTGQQEGAAPPPDAPRASPIDPVPSGTVVLRRDEATPPAPPPAGAPDPLTFECIASLGSAELDGVTAIFDRQRTVLIASSGVERILATGPQAFFQRYASLAGRWPK